MTSRKIIDLSQTIDADLWDSEDVTIEYVDAVAGAEHMRSEMKLHFDLDLPDDLFPNGEFLSIETVTLSTHTGTHVDAPAHYGSPGEGLSEVTIDRVPLEWCIGDGVLLRIPREEPGFIAEADVRAALDAIGHMLSPREIVLIDTGAERHVGTPAYFTQFAGLDLSAISFLYEAGIRVVGTDAFSLDAPFTYIINQFKATGDRSKLWPSHFFGRTHQYSQIERLANLDSLPTPTGFTVSCLPVKVKNAGAAWSRVVAIYEEGGPTPPPG